MESIRKSATTHSLPLINSAKIIDALRATGALSRQQLAKETGLSLATVNRLSLKLVNDGVLAVAGHGPSNGGRRSTLLRYDGGNRTVASVQVGNRALIGALVNFDGEIIYRQKLLMTQQPAKNKLNLIHGYIEELKELISRLVAAADGMNKECSAISIAIPGVVDPAFRSHMALGETHDSNLNWNIATLLKLLEKRFGLPVVMENDANCFAYGEFRSGSGKGSDNLVAVIVGSGLGAGIISHGEIHQGAGGRAGEIGYLLTGQSAFKYAYSARGHLESWLEPSNLTRIAKERNISMGNQGSLTIQTVIDLAESGDSSILEIYEEMVETIAMGVAALVVVLDPELVIVGGHSDGYRSLASEIKARLAGRLISVPRMVSADIPKDAVLVGAAYLAIERVQESAYP